MAEQQASPKRSPAEVREQLMNFACLSRGKNRCESMHVAAERNCCLCLSDFIISGEDPSATDKYDWTPLHIAVRKSNIEAARLLLENQATVGAPDKRGWTPLHHAVRGGDLEVCKVLIQYGANPLTPAVAANPTPEEPTPMDFANASGKRHIATLLTGTIIVH